MNILIVESDADSLELLKEIVEDASMNGIGTSTIENAFEIIKKGITIDAILLSLMYENKERFDIIESLQKATQPKTVPIIAIASSSRTHEGAQAQQSGCAAFVSKPIDEEELITTIKETVGSHDKNISS